MPNPYHETRRCEGCGLLFSESMFYETDLSFGQPYVDCRYCFEFQTALDEAIDTASIEMPCVSPECKGGYTYVNLLHEDGRPHTFNTCETIAEFRYIVGTCLTLCDECMRNLGFG